MALIFITFGGPQAHGDSLGAYELKAHYGHGSERTTDSNATDLEHDDNSVRQFTSRIVVPSVVPLT